MSAECGVCGAHGPYTVHPGNGHAGWCPRVTAWLRAEAERNEERRRSGLSWHALAIREEAS